LQLINSGEVFPYDLAMAGKFLAAATEEFLQKKQRKKTGKAELFMPSAVASNCKKMHNSFNTLSL
jgi:hypothetical protein